MDEILFSGRNKDYGAYRIRRFYHANIFISFAVTHAIVAVLIYCPRKLSPQKKTEKVKVITFEPIADLPPLPAAPPKSKSAPEKPEKENSQASPAKEKVTPSEDAQQIDGGGDETGETNIADAVPDGIEGAEGDVKEGEAIAAANKMNGQIFYIKVPENRSGKVENIYDDDLEKEYQSGRKISGKFLDFSSPHIHRLTYSHGYVHIGQSQSFVMIQDTIAINMAKIEDIKNDSVVLQNGKSFKIDGRHKKLLNERLTVFNERPYDLSEVLAAGNDVKKDTIFRREGGRIAEREVKLNVSTNDLIYSTTELGLGDENGPSSALQKAISKRRLQSAVEDTRSKMEEAIIRQRIAEEEAMEMYRPYGKPDAFVKIDQSMIALRDIGQVLQGRVAGVQVTYVKGQPIIQIRGAMSLSGSITEPLYLLNGSPVPKEAIVFLPVSTISVIDVLKSPDNTALYGSRGSGGVINVITTMPPVISESAADLKRSEVLADSKEKGKHLKEAKGQKMKREEFAIAWITDHNNDNIYAQQLLALKIYHVKRCRCARHYCNGWRMEYDHAKFMAWMKAGKTINP